MNYNFYEVAGLLAGLISFSAYLLYVWSILKGKTKPNRATWWILTLVGIMIASSYYAGGARETIWVALSYIIGPLMIASLSLKYGEGQWETLDKVCLVVALLSAVIWYLFSSPLLVLLMNIIMDFVGIVPTIKKSYLRPDGEDRPAWTLESIAGVVNILAVQHWSFAIAFYPVYLLCMNGTITLLLYRPLFEKKLK